MYIPKEDLTTSSFDALKLTDKSELTTVLPVDGMITRVIKPSNVKDGELWMDFPKDACCIYQCQLIARGEDDIIKGLIKHIHVFACKTLSDVSHNQGMLFLHTQPNVIDLMTFFASDEYIEGWAGAHFKVKGDSDALERATLRISYTKQPLPYTLPFQKIKASIQSWSTSTKIEFKRPRCIILRTTSTIDYVEINGAKKVEGKKLEIKDVDNNLYPMIRSQKKKNPNLHFYGISFVPDVWQHQSASNRILEPESVQVQYSCGQPDATVTILEVCDQ